MDADAWVLSKFMYLISSFTCGATSFFTSAEELRATVPAAARIVLSPLILLQDDDFCLGLV